MKNNCVTSCRESAVYLSGGMFVIRLSNAYYANSQIGYPSSDTLPIYLDDDPFVNGVGTGPYYIVQDCNMVDTAYTYDEVTYQISQESIVNTMLIGKTTSATGAYDSGTADIGYHYQGWEIVTMDPNLVADIDLNDVVNLTDFSLFSQQWLNTYDPNLVDPNTPGPVTLADFDNNGSVDVNDLMTMTSQWLYTRGNPYPDIDVTFDQEVDNIVGNLEISINVSEPDVISRFLLLDGEILVKDDESNSLSNVILESWLYSNGQHSLRVFGVLSDGGVVYSENITVNFNNTLYYVAGGEYFDSTNGYKFTGFYDGSDMVQASVLDMYGATIWSSDFSGPNVNIDIPGSAFSTNQFCELAISETSGAMAPMSSSTSSSGVTKKDLVKKFDKESFNGCRMLIILPDKKVYKLRKPAIIECAEACNEREVSWTALYHHDVTEENLRTAYGHGYVKYIYWCGHANAHIGDPAVARTHTFCWERIERNWLPDKWEKIGVFSWTNDVDVPLPGDWDDRGVNLESFHMYNSSNKKIVFVDGCLSAVYYDNALAYGMLSGYSGQIYIGWREEIIVSTGKVEEFVGNTTEGIRLFWERMGSEDTVQEALNYTWSRSDAVMRRTMWGDNEQVDIGLYDEDDNLFIWGNDSRALDEKLDP